MPRPTNKQMLLELAESNYQKLMAFIEDLSSDECDLEFPEGTLNRRLSDVLFHLHEWHLLMLQWYKLGSKGVKPDMPMKGYTWKDNAKLNRMLWERNRHKSLSEALLKLQESHQAVYVIIEDHSEQELFEKKRYFWTGSTSLAAYLISATSSHYDWALKLGRRVFKELKKESHHDT